MVLPLGLSYFAFTILSYHIEIKRKTILPETHFGYFSLYLLFFPKLAQGPIERPNQFLPQLHQFHHFNYSIVIDGLKQILYGYFKKLVIADRLAIYVNAVYGNSEHHNGISLAFATVFFAFQIYADFSSYTDIALGSAKLFGFNLSDNFKRPYLSTSIKDFWTRWHITFSTWIRDYIFLPLAFFLAGKAGRRKYLWISSEKWIYAIAISLTYAICGIWHGVGWTYLIWGILFGVYLTYANLTRDIHKNIRKQFHIKKTDHSYIVCKTILIFILVSFTWIFFRADSLKESIEIIGKIVSLTGPIYYGTPSNFIFGVLGIILLIINDLNREYYNNRLSLLYNRNPSIRILGIVGIVITILLIGVFDGGQFIYFQF